MLHVCFSFIWLVFIYTFHYWQLKCLTEIVYRSILRINFEWTRKQKNLFTESKNRLFHRVSMSLACLSIKLSVNLHLNVNYPSIFVLFTQLQLHSKYTESMTFQSVCIKMHFHILLMLPDEHQGACWSSYAIFMYIYL